MSLAHKDIYKAIVTKGNLGFATAGQALFTSIGSGRNRRVIYNVRPGQPVAYTIANGTATTQTGATITAADLPGLFVGVGVDLNGDGVTDDIRHLGIEKIGGCNIKEYSVSSPRCGGPAVSDFYFDCTQCDETYTVMVRIDDNRTRSYSPFNGSFMDFVASIVTQCFSCDTCPVEHNCKEVACKLSDALNGELDFRVGNNLYPDWKGQGLPRPFYATRLHENSYIYCFAPESIEGECETCTHLDGIGGVRVRGVLYPLVANVDPANTGKTLIGQLDGIVAQINDIFVEAYGGSLATGVNPHAGSAYATGSYQQCCSVQLHVNTCDADFELVDENQTLIEPQTANNPFEVYGTVDTNNNCIGCDDQALAARGVLTLDDNPSNGETVTLGAKVYTFQTVLTNVDGNVLIGATASASIDNLVDAINLGAGAGTTYAAAMTLHPTVSAINGVGDTMVVEAKTPGTAGNAIATTETLDGEFGDVTLLGGTAGTAAATTSYPCGIRVIAEQLKGGCGCFIDQPLAFYGRKLEIRPIGEAWRGKPWKVIEVQAMELPAGFGSFVQWLEYQTPPEGRGRRYSRSNINQGWANLPDKKSRVRHAVTADCADNYCQYYIRNLIDKKNPLDKYEVIEVNSNLFIPVGDDTTIAAWEAFATALLSLSPQCKIPADAACDTNFGGCSEE